MASSSTGPCPKAIECREDLRRESLTEVSRGALRDLFYRALAKAQALPARVRSKGALDPDQLVRCKPGVDLKKAFDFDRCAADVYSRRFEELLSEDAMFRFRSMIGESVWWYRAGTSSVADFMDQESKMTVSLMIKGVRTAPQGCPLLEVLYMYKTRANENVQPVETLLSQLMAMYKQSIAEHNDSKRDVKAEVVEVMLL
ncbi:hypothetical protein WJX73_001256 [Symbiochloris irregularis]|uniref:Uncharacterized protein n=1 Tax=Symbiochloris irregularis TaxID=706552 RepID=A0AAW1NI32_9CHLO